MTATPTRYRCSAAARWLPRTLAGAALAAAMLASFRIDPRVDSLGWGPVRTFVVLAGAVVALLIVRKGAEVRTVVELSERAVCFRSGARESTLPLAEIESLQYATPFSASRHWLPAAVLIDRGGGAWRLSALLAGGAELIDGLIDRTGRSDLESWADVLGLHRRMGRARALCALGYLVAAGLVLAGLVFYFTAP